MRTQTVASINQIAPSTKTAVKDTHALLGEGTKKSMAFDPISLDLNDTGSFSPKNNRTLNAKKSTIFLHDGPSPNL